jgi:hypothetical protein
MFNRTNCRQRPGLGHANASLLAHEDNAPSDDHAVGTISAELARRKAEKQQGEADLMEGEGGNCAAP